MIGDYYEPSEEINLAPLLTSSLFALIIGSILQLLAVLIGAWQGSLFVELILTSIAALLLTAIFRITFVLAKLRNIIVARITAFILSLILYYIHMSAFFALLLCSDERGIATSSYYITKLPVILQTTLAVSLRPTTVFESFLNIHIESMGLMIPIFTIGSFLVTILLPQISAKRTLQPFCEEQNAWMKAIPSTGKMTYFQQEELEDLQIQLEEGHTMDLLSRPLLNKQNQNHYGILIFYKVKKKNVGFVEVVNCKLEPNQNSEHMITPYIPPIMLGQEKADELEDYINSGKLSRNIFLTSSSRRKE